MAYEFQHIIDIVLDEDIQKYVVRFAFSNGEIDRTYFLKFENEPTEEEILQKADIIISSYNEE